MIIIKKLQYHKILFDSHHDQLPIILEELVWKLECQGTLIDCEPDHLDALQEWFVHELQRKAVLRKRSCQDVFARTVFCWNTRD